MSDAGADDPHWRVIEALIILNMVVDTRVYGLCWKSTPLTSWTVAITQVFLEFADDANSICPQERFSK
jgi:hypothetical protein